MAKRRLPTLPLTKLAPPSSEGLLLARPEVLSVFCTLRAHKLALVTAPSGSGKSTLMSQGYLALAAQGMDVCWLSLDASDNDVQRFCASLIAAVQRARPAAGSDAYELMRSAARVPLQEVMASVINDLTTSTTPLAIFLDDFQEVTDGTVQSAVSFLLQYSPASIRFAIPGQTQPPLAIARLRARGAVLELGFAELRFSPLEIRDYLRGLKKLQVSRRRSACWPSKPKAGSAVCSSPPSPWRSAQARHRRWLWTQTSKAEDLASWGYVVVGLDTSDSIV